MGDSKDFLPELEWRGLLKDVTDRDALSKHLSSASRRLYAGFDPTADSLTIGNLVPIMILAHAKKAGHEVVALMGGGTGLIGDPSGKSAERQLLIRETIESYVAAQRPIFDNVLSQVEGPAHTVVNNADWLTKLGYIEVLRDVGKHFSVNMMVQKDSVKSRLEDREQGISYTEFSYMILQAYDFLHLYRERGVTVQLGGSDQYGNIVAGTDLIRRDYHARLADQADRERVKRGIPPGRAVGFVPDEPDVTAFGFTAPLVTKADGGKFGKTETGAVWLTAARTSPYAYYQFWLNCSDKDVGPPQEDGTGGWLRKFTFLPPEEIEALEAEHAEAPGKRAAQRRLAQEATRLLHGQAEMEQAEAAGKALFSGDIASLNESTMREVFAEVPSSEHSKTQLAGEGADLVDILVETGLAKSKRESREFIASGSVSINGQPVGEGRSVTTGDLLHGSMIALRRGKKAWHVTKWA